MGEYVTDGQSLILKMTSSSNLGTVASDVFKAADSGTDTVHIPSVVCADVMSQSPELSQELLTRLRHYGTRQKGYKLEPLDLQILEAVSFVPERLVPEISDRIVTATAWWLELPLITNKHEIVDSKKVEVIWDVKTEEDVRLFMSYAREDESRVAAIYHRLKYEAQMPRLKCTPWMAQEDILPGKRWQAAIYKEIEQAHIFLAFLSTSAADKRGMLQKEIVKAIDVSEGMLEDDVYIIPIRLDECELPDRLSEYQYVDLFRDDGWGLLLRTIEVEMSRRFKIGSEET